MHSFLKTGIALSIILCFSACHINTVSPEPGNLTTTTRPVSGFTGLRIEDGIQATLMQGTTESVQIETREGYQPYFLTEVTNGILRIYIDRRLNDNKVKERRAVVTLKSFNSLTTSGGARVTSTDTFSPGTLSISVSGGGFVGLPLTTDALALSSSGGSEISLTGTARTVSVSQLSGGSTLRLANLTSTACTLDASGGSTAEVNVSQELAVTASGGSTIRYQGTPRITQKLSGGSSVSPL